MTPDLLNALADVLDALGALRDSGILDVDFSDQTDEALDALGATGDAVSVALGIEADTTWQETATALRLHADKTDAATNAALLATTTSTLLNRLADLVSRLRHMWDDTDGDTHLPVEESDDICAIGTEMAAMLDCKDDWPDIATALRLQATTLTPGLSEGWEWCDAPLFLAYAANREAGVWVAVGSDGNLYINGGFGRTINHADAAAVRAVLARAGVGS